MEAHDRRGLMRAFRRVLLERGFVFCDEGEAEAPTFPLPPPSVRAATEPLLLEGVDASSTDSPQQGVGCTLEDSGQTFWSSTGSSSPDSHEFLLYKLKSPLCMVRNVQLIVFRAHYQFGEPIYPPAHISFQAGPAPWRLAPPTIKYPVAATDAVQCFPLPADLPLGRYLRINLHGKRQQQLEDLQWYHAIQRVEAFGHHLPAGAVAGLRDWAARQVVPLPAPGVIPSYLAAEVLQPQQPQPSPEEQQRQEGQQQEEQQQQQQHAQQQCEAGDGGKQWQHGGQHGEPRLCPAGPHEGAQHAQQLPERQPHRQLPERQPHRQLPGPGEQQSSPDSTTSSRSFAG